MRSQSGGSGRAHRDRLSFYHSPNPHRSVSCDSKQQPRYESMPFVPGGGPQGSVSEPEPLLSKKQVNMFSII